MLKKIDDEKYIICDDCDHQEIWENALKEENWMGIRKVNGKVVHFCPACRLVL